MSIYDILRAYLTVSAKRKLWNDMFSIVWPNWAFIGKSSVIIIMSILLYANNRGGGHTSQLLNELADKYMLYCTVDRQGGSLLYMAVLLADMQWIK